MRRVFDPTRTRGDIAAGPVGPQANPDGKWVTFDLKQKPDESTLSVKREECAEMLELMLQMR